MKKSNIFHSVKTKLTVIMLLLVIIPVLTISLISYYSSIKTATETMNNLNTAQVNLVEHDFSSIVEQNQQMLQTVANSVSARKVLLGELDKESVKDWLTKVDEEMGDGNSLIITGPDGMQIVRTVGDCVDVSDREYFKKVKDEGMTFYVSDQNISKSTGQRICTFIHKVVDLDGNFIGAVQRNYNLSDFTELVKKEVTETNQDIFIADNNGDLIAHNSTDLETGQAVNQSDLKYYTMSRSSLEASGTYESLHEGVQRVMAFQREPITGWVTVVARDKSISMAAAKHTAMISIIISLILIAVATVIALILSKSFTAPISVMNRALKGLSEGSFNTIEEHKARKDEFGEMIRSTNSVIDTLKGIVNDIKIAATDVGASSAELAQTAGQISNTADGVSEAVQEIAKGATEQANTIQRATENVNNLSDAIQSVADNAQNLAATAATMNDCSQESRKALDALHENMRKMGENVSAVSDTMKLTNDAIEAMNGRVDGITNIASQTNLLALNASIEAARAGEAGKGFAVVAEEIGKLATESAELTNEIRAQLKDLLDQSAMASEKTSTVVNIGKEVTAVLEQTGDKVNQLIDAVGVTVDGINTISGISEECAAAKAEIVDAMDSLSAISEENAASTEETSASMEELNATVNELSASADNLSSIAKKLDEELEYFKE